MEKQPLEEFVLRLTTDVPISPAIVATLFDLRDQLYDGKWAPIKADLEGHMQKQGLLPRQRATYARDDAIITRLMEIEKNGGLSLQRDYAVMKAYVIQDQKSA